MDLSEIVGKVQANNFKLGEIEKELSDEEKLALLLEDFNSLPKEKYDTIRGLEVSNAQLAVQGLNLAIALLEGDRELDGTYWGAGEDFAYAAVRGVKRFQSQYYNCLRREFIKSRFGIDAISFDALKDEHPFGEGSQNFALQKTFGDYRQPAYEKLWHELLYTVKKGGLIITTDSVPDLVKDGILMITDQLSGFNSLEFKWLTGETGTYRPPRFEFYRKK